MIFFFAEEKRERQFLQAYEVLQEVEAELEELAELGGQDTTSRWQRRSLVISCDGRLKALN